MALAVEVGRAKKYRVPERDVGVLTGWGGKANQLSPREKTNPRDAPFHFPLKGTRRTMAPSIRVARALIRGARNWRRTRRCTEKSWMMRATLSKTQNAMGA
jgi:hypothetical protein